METGIEAHWYSFLQEKMELDQVDPATLSPLDLAYMGDGIYELLIRTMLLSKGNQPVNRLHSKASRYVKAGTQAELVTLLLPDLTEEEKTIVRRGRNAKSYTTAKNATVTEYRMATAFEALAGWLYLTGQMERLIQLVQKGLKEWRSTQEKK